MFRRSQEQHVEHIDSGQLEIGERIYESIPAPLMDVLLDTRGVGEPTAVVESIERSTGIPWFGQEGFDELMVGCDEIVAEANREVRELRRQQQRRRR